MKTNKQKALEEIKFASRRATSFSSTDRVLHESEVVSIVEFAARPDVLETVVDQIKSIPQRPQVQYDLHRQLMELRIAANKLGLYDAADFLRTFTENK